MSARVGITGSAASTLATRGSKHQGLHRAPRVVPKYKRTNAVDTGQGQQVTCGSKQHIRGGCGIHGRPRRERAQVWGAALRPASARVSTGAASSAGLGCARWPRCSAAVLRPAMQAAARIPAACRVRLRAARLHRCSAAALRLLAVCCIAALPRASSWCAARRLRRRAAALPRGPPAILWAVCSRWVRRCDRLSRRRARSRRARSLVQSVQRGVRLGSAGRSRAAQVHLRLQQAPPARTAHTVGHAGAHTTLRLTLCPCRRLPLHAQHTLSDEHVQRIPAPSRPHM